MIRAIAIDDEEASLKTLITFAGRMPEQLKIIGSALHAQEGLLLIEDYKPDAVFLDISMPGMNGFELLDKFPSRNFKVVFTTAHEEHAIRAIKNKASDYLLKPIDFDDFKHCISLLAEKETPLPYKQDGAMLVGIKAKDGVIYLKQSEIVRVEASGSYTEFYMDNKIMHLASTRMGGFETRLDPNLFFRCHKSHIINLRKVQKFIHTDGFFALMSDGSMPDVSKSLKDAFLHRLDLI